MPEPGPNAPESAHRISSMTVEDMLSHIESLPTFSARSKLFEREIKELIEEDFRNSDHTPAFIVALKELSEIPFSDQDGNELPATKHLTVVYPFEFERKYYLTVGNGLETILLDYTAQFPYLDGTSQRQIAQQSRDRRHRKKRRQAKKYGVELSAPPRESDSFDWDASRIIKELLLGNKRTMWRIVIKVPCRNRVNIYGKSGHDLLPAISKGLRFESPSRSRPIPAWNIEYFVWEKLDRGALTWA
ncbi:hypothetical protein EG329_010427 [Mollisiaceae sp. DMI_Dod_QoI]|nr:hypothetical protein EG329_010427 [Helotiales sp. DMI_Dod_QoI]